MDLIYPYLLDRIMKTAGTKRRDSPLVRKERRMSGRDILAGRVIRDVNRNMDIVDVSPFTVVLHRNPGDRERRIQDMMERARDNLLVLVYISRTEKNPNIWLVFLSISSRGRLRTNFIQITKMWNPGG